MKKLLIVSRYPKNGKIEGEFRRILEIDRCFSEIPRLYLELSFTQNRCAVCENISDKISVERLNIFLHFLRIYHFLKQSAVIYVATMGNSLRILPAYMFHSLIVSDIHGIQTEEIREYGAFSWISRKCRFFLYRLVEYIVAKRSRKIVTVTKEMTRYIQRHYTKDAKCIEIPIFVKPIEKNENVEKDMHLYIYAGGIHGWQKIDLMIETMKKIANHDEKAQFIILSASKDMFLKKMQGTVLEERVVVDCVPPENLPDYYSRAGWGFILRDDNAVNRVACPTKLIEYMEYGVLPIIKSKYLGDFEEYGYSAFSYELMPQQISLTDLKKAQEINYHIVHKIRYEAEQELGGLKQYILNHLEG
ncbi:MAG: hypothetical protein ACFN4Y_00735 [Centipeda sp. (in: firmicutes)]